jgi:aspartate racemase
MKKIGLIGGMSWESSQVYYKIINEKVREALGGFHSSKCVMESVDFAEIEKLQHEEDWDSLNKLMVNSAKNLENAKADIIVLCTNTMHLCSTEIIKNVSIPFLHIAVATGKKIKEQKISKVLLLGTKFTMEKDFYKKVLIEDFGIEVITPNEKDRKIVHKIIYEELVQGKIKSTSRIEFQKIINNSIENGAEGVILGCTEIPLLIKSSDVNIPVFDTTRIHAESAVEFSLK